MMMRTLPLALLLIALAAPAALAQEAAQRTAVDDALFAAAAADSGLAEVSLSQLGLQKATDAELKKFSQRMVEEHTRFNQELKSLASQKGIPVSPAVDVRARYCAQSLAGLMGEKFDQCYAKAQLTMHMEAVAAFEAEAERGQDRDLKAFAAKGLPHIKEHLMMIKPIAMRYYEKESDNSKASAVER